jgi:hypothetical protein
MRSRAHPSPPASWPWTFESWRLLGRFSCGFPDAWLSGIQPCLGREGPSWAAGLSNDPKHNHHDPADGGLSAAAAPSRTTRAVVRVCEARFERAAGRRRASRPYAYFWCLLLLYAFSILQGVIATVTSDSVSFGTATPRLRTANQPRWIANLYRTGRQRICGCAAPPSSRSRHCKRVADSTAYDTVQQAFPSLSACRCAPPAS